MEYLSILFELEHLEGNLSPVYKNSPVINHLLYEDDLLVFVEAIIENATTVKDIMQKLKIYAGLAMNEQKSKLFFSKGACLRSRIAEILLVEIQNLPITYWVLPSAVLY